MHIRVYDKSCFSASGFALARAGIRRRVVQIEKMECLSISLSIYVSIYPSVCLSIYIHIYISNLWDKRHAQKHEHITCFEDYKHLHRPGDPYPFIWIDQVACLFNRKVSCGKPSAGGQNIFFNCLDLQLPRFFDCLDVQFLRISIASIFNCHHTPPDSGER